MVTRSFAKAARPQQKEVTDMAMHRFKSAYDNKFGRCSSPERKACLACDAEGKRACLRMKKLMAEAAANQRSPIKEPGSKGDRRPYISRPHQGLRLYLTPHLDGMMRTYDYLVSWLKAGANGSYLIASRTAAQHARARGLSKKVWHTHIRQLKALDLIDTIPRRHVAPSDVVGAEAYVVLPLPDWVVELAKTLHHLGQLKKTETKLLAELQARKAAVIAEVESIIKADKAERRRAPAPAVEVTAAAPAKRQKRKWVGEL